DRAVAAAVIGARRSDGDVFGSAPVDLDGVRERLPANESLHDVRIARRRELALVPLARDQEGVLADPPDVVFPLVEQEAGLREHPRREVDLTDRGRILAAVGEGE